MLLQGGDSMSKQSSTKTSFSRKKAFSSRVFIPYAKAQGASKTPGAERTRTEVRVQGLRFSWLFEGWDIDIV